MLTEYQKRILRHQANAPLCRCGCGCRVNWNPKKKGYNEFLFNHHIPDKSKNWDDTIEQIVRGTILGDGHLDVRLSRSGVETGSARLQLRHSTKRQSEYIQWLYDQLKPITQASLRFRKTNQSFGFEVAEFSTISIPQLYEIYKETYVNRKKVVTLDYLQKLSDLGFAIWWADDGSSNSLCTHSFSLEENEIIKKWLLDRYDIKTTIRFDKRVNKHFIGCGNPAMRKVAAIVYNHLHHSLRYKIVKHMPMHMLLNNLPSQIDMPQ